MTDAPRGPTTEAPQRRSRLGPHRAEIVRLHVQEGWTLSEIGDAFDVSRERIRQIVKEAGAPSLTRERMRALAETRRLMAAVAYAARREALAPPLHGVRYRYDQGCRCDDCTTANHVYMASLRGTEPARHGTASAYFNYGCRCEPCRDAGSLRNREMRHFRIARRAA